MKRNGEWSAFDKLDDKQIAEAVAKDRDAAPVDDGDFWKNAVLHSYMEAKK